MSIYGALGEPMSDHLEPPDWYDCDDEEEEDGYTSADAELDEATDDFVGRVLEADNDKSFD